MPNNKCRDCGTKITPEEYRLQAACCELCFGKRLIIEYAKRKVPKYFITRMAERFHLSEKRIEQVVEQAKEFSL